MTAISRRLSPRALVASEVLGLLVAPVVLFFLLGEQGMTQTNIEDQRFYQAYAEHGDDLMLRLGDYRYFWVRLAFILPARVAYDLFGALNGFFVWRYVLALVAVAPAYLLVRRLHGRAAAWVVVPTILAAPVILYAWGTDYPDSSAVSYLLCGTACLFMPSGARPFGPGDGGRPRWGWLVAAGVAHSLAIHSQFVAGPLVAVAWIVYALMRLRRSSRWGVTEGVVLAACAVAVTAVLSLIALTMWGRWNILWPTVRAAEHFRTPNELRKWHSPNWRWVLRNTYLLVPYLVPVLWWVVRRRGGRDVPCTPEALRTRRVEAGLAAVGLLQMLLFTYLQFFAITSELEYHVYSSMLWPTTLLVLTLAVVRLARPLLDRASTCWVPAVGAALVPWLLTFARSGVHFRTLAGIAVCAGIVALVWVCASGRSPATLMPVGALIVVAGVYLLTTAEPPGQVWLTNQRHFPQPDYAHALRNDGAWHLPEASYLLNADLVRAAPKATAAGQTLLTWFAGSDAVSSDLTTQWMWTPQSLAFDFPNVSTTDERWLVARHCRTLLIFSPDPAQLQAATDSLASTGFAPSVDKKVHLQRGPLHDDVWVLTLHARV